MKRLLLATAVLLTAAPSVAGDLGVYDEWVPGVNARSVNTSQRVFDAGLGQVTFTPGRLAFTIEPKSSTTKAVLKDRLARFLETTEQGYIEPAQVDSYSTFFSGGGLFFQILYTARSGGKSVATVGFANANTAMSFHQVFLDWWNGRLEAQPPVPAVEKPEGATYPIRRQPMQGNY